MSIYQPIIESHIDRIKSSLPVEKQADVRYAFLVFTTSTILGISLNEAISSIVDGADDGALDAIYIDETESNIIISFVQSKYRDNTNKGIGFNDVNKTLNSVERILGGHDSKKHSQKLKEKIAEVREINKAKGLLKAPIVNVYFITNGRLPDDSEREQAYLFEQKGDNKVYFIDSQNILAQIQSKKQSIFTVRVQTYGPKLKHEFGGVTGYITTLAATQLIRIYDQGGGDKVLDKNIRNFLGDNKINKNIRVTAESENYAKYFWFFNNGVSIVCDKLKSSSDGSGNDFVELENPSIVNGGQTTKTLSLLNSQEDGEKKRKLQNVYLLVRFYETSDQNLVTKITEGTNSQNPINIRDLKANDEVQNIVKIYFKQQDLFLETKRNEYKERSDVPQEKIANNQRVFQAYIALYKNNPHEAKGRKSAAFQNYFDEIFTKENSQLPKQFYRSYVILNFIEEREKNTKIIQINSYLPHADIALVYLMGLINNRLKSIDSPKESTLEKAYQKANKVIKKIVKQQQGLLKETYSHNKLFKSSLLKDLAEKIIKYKKVR